MPAISKAAAEPCTATPQRLAEQASQLASVESELEAERARAEAAAGPAAAGIGAEAEFERVVEARIAAREDIARQAVAEAQAHVHAARCVRDAADETVDLTIA